MRNLLLIMLLAIISLAMACIGSEAASTLAPIVAYTPTRTPPPMLPTATPDYRATAQRLEAIVTAEIGSVERGRLELDGTQAGHEMSMQEINAARQNELDRTRTAAEAYAIISRAQIEVSATANALQILSQNAALANSATAQQMALTQVIIEGAKATQTADAPLAYVRQRAQLTELSASATVSADGERIAANNAAYWRGFWRVVLAALFMTLVTLAWGLILSVDARRRERLMQARASAARQRIINTSGGPTFAGDSGAQAIQQGNRPLVNMSYQDNSAGWAQSPQTEPTPPREPMREKVGKLLLDSVAVVGWDGNTIPSADDLEWSSDSERQLAVDWLRAAGAVYTRVGKGTYVSLEWETIRNLYQALQNGQLQVIEASDGT